MANINTPVSRIKWATNLFVIPDSSTTNVFLYSLKYTLNELQTQNTFIFSAVQITTPKSMSKSNQYVCITLCNSG